MARLSRYSSIEVKPTIKASYQHAGTYGAQDVFFDWTAFKLPKGGNKLIGFSMMYNGPAGINDPAPCEVLFARQTTGGGDITAGTAPATLGNANTTAFAVASNPNFRQIVGGFHILESDFLHTVYNIGTTNVGTTNNHGIVLDEYGASLDDSEGNITYYIGATTTTASPNLSSNVQINGSQDGENDLLVKTTDPTLMFAPGDVLHTHTDVLIGTVGTVTTSTNILLEGTTTTGVAAANLYLYNINPITIRLSFER